MMSFHLGETCQPAEREVLHERANTTNSSTRADALQSAQHLGPAQHVSDCPQKKSRVGLPGMIRLQARYR